MHRDEILTSLSNVFPNENWEKKEVDHFLSGVDDSDYSLQDWLAALREFDQWLQEKNIDLRPIPEMIEYLHCSAAGQGPGVPEGNLSEVLRSNLEQYGFARTDDSQG